MCDSDTDNEFITSKDVRTRKPHECGSCLETFPAGTRMLMYVGKTDGAIFRDYTCDTCEYCAGVSEDSEFHICDGDLWGADKYDEATWRYRFVRAHREARSALVEPADASNGAWRPCVDKYQRYRAAVIQHQESGDGPAPDPYGEHPHVSRYHHSTI